MCKVKTPEYEEAPEYSREKAPDNAGLYEEAAAQAATRSGGKTRLTQLTTLRGLTTTPNTAAGAQRSTRLG